MELRTKVLYKELTRKADNVQFSEFKKNTVMGETFENYIGYIGTNNYVNITYMPSETENNSAFVIQDQYRNLYRTSSFIDMYNTCSKLLQAQSEGIEIIAVKEGRGDIYV